MNWQNVDEAPPRILVLPPAAASLDEAHGAIEQWEFYSRKTLDPPQKLAVEVMMAETASGRWAARTTGREMPRQNGKGDELEVVEFWGLTQRGEAILHTAHELNTVSSAHQRMVALLSHRDFKGKRTPRVLNGIGQQLISMGDAVIQYRTRTAGGGRGLDDISRLIVDEAQHARPEQLASATPILLANPNPQMNFAGTGGITGVSDWWWSFRIRALGTAPGDFGYVGHTAENVYLNADGKVIQDPVDASDRGKWPAPNPALTFGRGEMAFFEEQLLILGPTLFAREHLGVWDPPPLVTSGVVISAEAWTARCRPNAEPGEDVAFGLSIKPDRSSGAVGVSDGTYVEVVDHHDGTGWVFDRVVELCTKHKAPIAIDNRGAAASFVDALEAAGVTVVSLSTADVVQACGSFFDAATEGDLVHIGDPPLDAAVKGADRRDVGDAWAWSRKTSTADIEPLNAVTFARWLASADYSIDPVANVW